MPAAIDGAAPAGTNSTAAVAAANSSNLAIDTGFESGLYN
jgi:hypothetical protein